MGIEPISAAADMNPALVWKDFYKVSSDSRLQPFFIWHRFRFSSKFFGKNKFPWTVSFTPVIPEFIMWTKTCIKIWRKACIMLVKLFGIKNVYNVCHKKSPLSETLVARMGIEPITSGLWILRSNQLSYLAIILIIFPTWELEPSPPRRIWILRSNQLSYLANGRQK